MAIFITNCAICKAQILEETPYLATSGVAFVPPHPLYEFCDVGLHQSCLINWQFRKEFSSGYFFSSGTEIVKNDNWLIGIGPYIYGPGGEPNWPYYLEVRFSEWLIRLYAKFQEWPEYIKTKPWQAENIEELNNFINGYYSEFSITLNEIKSKLLISLKDLVTSDIEAKIKMRVAKCFKLFPNETLVSLIPFFKEIKESAPDSVRHTFNKIIKDLNLTESS